MRRRRKRRRRERDRRGRQRGRGKEVKLASNLITQINVAWREQLPKWTKKREREREKERLLYSMMLKFLNVNR